MTHIQLPRLVAAVLLVFPAMAGLAQLPSLNFGGGAGAPGTDFATMLRLLGSQTGFTARYEVRMLDKDQKETLSAAMNFAYLENKIRLEIDVAQMKNKDLPANLVDQLKQVGMDQFVTLIRPDKKSILVVCPRLEASLTQPLQLETAKIEKQPIGKEALDDQPCVKNKVTFTPVKGAKEELTVWCATNLKDFPVQFLTKQNGETVIARFKQIQLVRPEARLFDLPAGFKEYNDTASFMAGVTAKILAGDLLDAK